MATQRAALRFADVLAWPFRAVCAWLVFCAPHVPAQTPATSPPAETPAEAAAAPDSSTMTLHVYAAHVQMPALVLTPSLQLLPSLPADRFAIRLDGGPPFPPSSVRPEGDDPIALAVLLDVGGETERLAAEFAPTLIHLRTVVLRPQDTLWLYAMDCKLVRYSIAVPNSAAAVERALKSVLGNTALHLGSTLPVCGGGLRLWDSLGSMVVALADQPARRVVLAFTAGRDGGSKLAWSTVRSYAALRSVAFFALSKPQIVNAPHITETPLWNICALTGGLLLPVEHPRDLAQRVEDVVDMVRSRYILEFPRSNRLAGGSHSVEVQLSEMPRALIRLTGLSVPVLDEKLRDDPSTIPYREADGPAFGSRRPLQPSPTMPSPPVPGPLPEE